MVFFLIPIIVGALASVVIYEVVKRPLGELFEGMILTEEAPVRTAMSMYIAGAVDLDYFKRVMNKHNIEPTDQAAYISYATRRLAEKEEGIALQTTKAVANALDDINKKFDKLDDQADDIELDDFVQNVKNQIGDLDAQRDVLKLLFTTAAKKGKGAAELADLLAVNKDIADLNTTIFKKRADILDRKRDRLTKEYNALKVMMPEIPAVPGAVVTGPAAEKGSVIMIFKDKDTLAYLQGVKITVSEIGTFTTDSSGQATVAGLDLNKNYVWTAEKAGYTTRTGSVTVTTTAPVSMGWDLIPEAGIIPDPAYWDVGYPATRGLTITNDKFYRYNPPVPISKSDTEKRDAPVEEGHTFYLADMPFDHEVVITKMWFGPVNLTGRDVVAHFIWSNDITGEVIFDFRHTLPQVEWTSFMLWAAIGRFADKEIYKRGLYKVKLEFIDPSNVIKLERTMWFKVI